MKICSNELIELQEIIVDFNKFQEVNNEEKIIMNLGDTVGMVSVDHYGENVVYFYLDNRNDIIKSIKDVKAYLCDFESYQEYLKRVERNSQTDKEIDEIRGKC